MSQLLVFAASVAGIGVLIGLAWTLGFRDRARLDEPRLRELARDIAPGAGIVRVRIDADGQAGLAWLADDRIVTAAVMGDRVAARLWREGDVSLRDVRGALHVTLPDLGYPKLTLREAR